MKPKTFAVKVVLTVSDDTGCTEEFSMDADYGDFEFEAGPPTPEGRPTSIRTGRFTISGYAPATDERLWEIKVSPHSSPCARLEAML